MFIFLVLANSGEDTVSMDDLDLLQQDLEKLLSNSAVRIRYLLAEIGEIDKNDEGHDRKAQIKVNQNKQINYFLKILYFRLL